MSRYKYEHIKVEDVNDVTVIRFLDRRILDTAKIAEIRADLDALKEDGENRKIVLVFSIVEFLSCAALNTLMLFQRWALSNDKKLRICEMKPEIMEVFIITRLSNFFSVYDTEDEAINSF